MGQFYEGALLKTYPQVAEWFTKCRDPEKGRPVRSWGRLYKVGDTYELRMGSAKICTFTPDNVLTFNLTQARAQSVSVTLSSSLSRAVPIMWLRIGVGRYNIGNTIRIDKWIDQNNKSMWLYRSFVIDKGEELFDGIQYNLDTGECINPAPQLNTVNSDKRVEWLRKSKKFKVGMRLRRKLGVLDTICQQVAQSRTSDRSTWQEPDWGHDKWMNLLYTSVNENQYPTELIEGFVKSSQVSFWKRETPTPEATLTAMESVFKNYSLRLRRMFGVFEESKDEQ